MEEGGEEEGTTLLTLEDHQAMRMRADAIIKESLTLLTTSNAFTIFLPITLLTAIPISLLLSFSLSSAQLRAEISYKEALLAALPPGIAAINVQEELVGDVCLLMKRKALAWAPIYGFSLISIVAAVRAVACSRMCQRPSFLTALASIRKGYGMRLVLTSLYVMVLKEAYDHLARAACGAMDRHVREGLVVVVIVVLWGALAVLRVYLIVVLGMGMVVSILEEMWGLEALVAGWEVVDGKRFSGCVLGGFQAVLNGGVGLWSWKFSEGMSWGGDGSGGGFILVALFSMMVVLNDVMYTIFYLEFNKHRSDTLPRELVALTSRTSMRGQHGRIF